MNNKDIFLDGVEAYFHKHLKIQFNPEDKHYFEMLYKWLMENE